MHRPIRVFLSHDASDHEHCAALETHLAAMVRRKSIEIRRAQGQCVGSVQDPEGRGLLEEVDLVVLLLSPSFLASDRCFDIDLRRAMERHAAGVARVLPVVVRPVDWSGLPVSVLQPAPADGRPVTSWEQRDEAWLSVVDSVATVVADLVEREKTEKVSLTVVEGPDKGRTFTFAQRDRFVIGRATDATFRVQDPQISRHHFLIEVNPPLVIVRDLGSTHGTFVNGERQSIKAGMLRSGDRIRAGGTVFQIEVIHPPAIIEESPPTGDHRTASLVPLTGPIAPTFTVRCVRCGEKATGEEPTPERVAYFCGACRVALLGEPLFPPGYTLVREIGRGAMGAVYLARHSNLGVERALKIILPLAAMTEHARRSFLREASWQARLRHPRIVEAYDLLEIKRGIFCIVMEHVDGEDAEALLKRSPARRLEPRLAATIVEQALDGLGHAHRHGIVHRDIKDANLLVGVESTGLSIKLADFGLAKAFETSGASGFTRTGETGGTLHYMAPEQIVDYRGVRPAADLYSMGVVLYRLLTGQFPVDIPPGDSPLAVLLENAIVPVRRREPSIEEALARVVERALQKRPEDRFESAEEMRRAVLATMP